MPKTGAYELLESTPSSSDDSSRSYLLSIYSGMTLKGIPGIIFPGGINERRNGALRVVNLSIFS